MNLNREACVDCARDLADVENEVEIVKQSQRQEAGSHYYPLFAHMADNHGLILLDSELEDICQIVMKMPLRDNLTHKSASA